MRELLASIEVRSTSLREGAGPTRRDLAAPVIKALNDLTYWLQEKKFSKAYDKDREDWNSKKNPDLGAMYTGIGDVYEMAMRFGGELHDWARVPGVIDGADKGSVDKPPPSKQSAGEPKADAAPSAPSKKVKGQPSFRPAKKSEKDAIEAAKRAVAGASDASKFKYKDFIKDGGKASFTELRNAEIKARAIAAMYGDDIFKWVDPSGLNWGGDNIETTLFAFHEKGYRKGMLA